MLAKLPWNDIKITKTIRPLSAALRPTEHVGLVVDPNRGETTSVWMEEPAAWDRSVPASRCSQSFNSHDWSAVALHFFVISRQHATPQMLADMQEQLQLIYLQPIEIIPEDISPFSLLMCLPLASVNVRVVAWLCHRAYTTTSSDGITLCSLVQSLKNRLWKRTGSAFWFLQSLQAFDSLLIIRFTLYGNMACNLLWKKWKQLIFLRSCQNEKLNKEKTNKK